MKKTIAVIGLVLILTLSVGSLAQVPKEKKLGVYDYTGQILSQTQIDSLNKIIWQCEQETTAEISVAIITPEQYKYYGSIEEAGTKILHDWGLGKEGIDNGLLFVICTNPRKLRIESGYWTEGPLNDGLLGKVRDKFGIPLLKQNDYYGALHAMMSECARLIKQRAPEEVKKMVADRSQQGTVKEKNFVIPLIILFGVIVLVGSGVWFLNRPSSASSSSSEDEVETPEISDPPATRRNRTTSRRVSRKNKKSSRRSRRSDDDEPTPVVIPHRRDSDDEDTHRSSNNDYNSSSNDSDSSSFSMPDMGGGSSGGGGVSGDF